MACTGPKGAVTANSKMEMEKAGTYVTVAGGKYVSAGVMCNAGAVSATIRTW